MPKPVSIKIESALLTDDPSNYFLSDDEQHARLQTDYSNDQKEAETHNLIARISGPRNAVDILGSLVTASEIIAGNKIKSVPQDQWKTPPYVWSRSSGGGTSTLPIHFATVDDLRLFFRKAHENEIEFEPGQVRQAIDSATQIMQAIGHGKQ